MPKQTGSAGESPKSQRKAVLEDTLLLNSVIKYFKYAGVASFVWLFGYLKFSVSWLLLVLVMYIWKDRHNKTKQYKIRISQGIARDEKEVILARVEDLPSWVNFPDVERAEWLNKMLDQMWPYIGEYVERILRETVEPALKNNLPPSLKSFKFSKIDLGDIPPRIGGVKVYTQLKRDEIYMDLEINYSSDSDIAVSIKGMNAGIKDLRLHGTLRVVFKPLINKVPLIGGMLVFFLNNPELDFNLTSLANAFDLPGLSDMLHSIIQEQIANFMVLPNRYPIKLAEGLDLNKLRYPQPQGVVRVTVLEAKDLKKADISLTGKGKSDPYVVIRVGAKQVKTKVIQNSVAPVWNQTFELIVDSADGQLMYIDVFDEDPGSSDDDLGRVSLDLSKLRSDGFADEWLPLEEVKQGLIHLQMTWLYLANDPLELDRVVEKNRDDEVAHSAILLVNLDSAANLPRGKKSLSEPSPQAILGVGQQTFESEIKQTTCDPTWEQHFRFMVHNPNFQNLEVELKDSKKSIGNTTIKLTELLVAEDMIMDQKFHIKTSEVDSHINMRLTLRVLTPTANPEWMDTDDHLISDEEEEKEGEDANNSKSNPEGTSVDKQGASKTSTKALAPSFSPSSKSPTSSPAKDQSKSPSPMPDEVITPTKASNQESAVRQRKAPSVNSAGDFNMGRIQMTFRYSPQRERLVVVVHKCINLQPVEGDSKNMADPYIKMYLLPDKSSSTKRKTKVVKDNLNPVFDETFEYPVDQQELPRRSLEISVKNEVGMFSSSKSLMGRVVLDLESLDTSKAVTEWFDIAPEDKARVTSLETDI